MPTKHESLPFLSLGEYAWPSLPADDRLRVTFERLKKEILRSDKADEPAVSDDLLAGATAQRLDDIASPPACGPLLSEMDISYAPWIGSSDTTRRVQLIVLPPCDENNVVASWAEQQGLPCLDAPQRSELMPVSDVSVPQIDGEGILVVPRLEDWFIRHQDGLHLLRALLMKVATSERRMIIGCNSWAWAYLTATNDVQLQMPQPQTFQAFDRKRLFDWFSKLASNPKSGVENFRLSETGVDVFDTSDDGQHTSDFFQKLAAHSLGIPWVAWSLWRRSLRTTREDADLDDEIEDNDETLWVAALDSFSLPVEHRQSALLVLQSLLIHGPLSVQDLRLTVPFVGSSNVVHALVSGGLVRLEDDLLSCVPAAYPTMRRELSNAGFSMDRL